MASQIESRPFARAYRQSEGHRFDLSQVSIPRVVVAIAMAVFLIVSVILLERRWAGAFTNSLTTFGYGLWMFLAGAFCAGLKCSVAAIPPRLSKPATATFGGLICCLLALFAWALFPTETNWLAAIGTPCWLGLLGWFCCSRSSVLLCQIMLVTHVWPVVAEFFQHSPRSPRSKGFADRNAECSSKVHPLSVPQPETHSLKIATVPDSEDTDAFLKFANPALETDESETEFGNAGSGAVKCRLVRRREANGDDVLEAHATAVFLVGARQTVLHIPFTPAFALTPQVECEITDGSDVRLKVGAIFPYGVRVELKRNDFGAGELEVAVDLFAVQTASRQAT
ncbi:MAG: hypothetical protein JWM11_40 [Planctomycetaceae bacterium]|nr:hypothetical protein [Planctomycetaceae bacterium]